MLRKAVTIGWRFVVAGLWVAVFAVGLTACPKSTQYPKCSADKDCHEHEYCVNGQCQQCRNDADCPSGQSCNQGRCEQKSQMSMSCTDDSQCPAGQSCIGGACKPCQSDDQCGVGGKCNAGRCDRSGASGMNGNNACSLEPIYFDFNENVLSTEATAAIDRDAECVKKMSNPGLVLTGHSDPRGTEEYNMALSDRRAQAVRDRLQRIGANPASMRMVPKGELEATGTDESGWAKDRRVDITTK